MSVREVTAKFAAILNPLTAAIRDEKDTWEAKIHEVQCGIHYCINSTTVKAPSALLYGFQLKLKYNMSLSAGQTDRQGLWPKRVKRLR